MMKHTSRPHLIYKLRRGKKSARAGNIFFMLFASIGLVAAFSLGANNLMKGLVTSMSDVTRKTIAEEKMASSARLVFQNPVETSPATADCDLASEPAPANYIEPLVTRDGGTLPQPAGGGLIPLNIGAETKDPWGTQYGYCAWDPGVGICADSVSPRRLRGAVNDPDATVVAIISAGKDRKFSTTCVPSGGNLPPADCTNLGSASYNDPNGHCYWKSSGTATAAAAQTACAASGGYLYAVNSDAEATTVADALGIGSEYIYADGNDNASEGRWVHATGETAGQNFWNGNDSTGTPVAGQFNKWNSGEPNGGTSENCIIVGLNSYNLFDYDCNGDLKYICEKDGGTGAPTPAADCSSLNPSSYYNDPVSKHCYYTTPTTTDFSNATASCTSSGAYLAAITSAGEDAMIDSHLQHYGSWIGISDEASEGVWKYTTSTLAGQQFWQGVSGSGNAVGGLYNNWDSSGEPNNSYGHENCGMKYYGGTNGGWFDGVCTDTNYAICEKDPPVVPPSSITRTAGSDDIVMEYSYNDIRGLGGQDLWQVNSTQANTATIDKNINVGGTTGSTFDGSINLLKDGLLLPNDATSGGCTVGGANEESLRLNTSTSPISMEICHGGAWVPISVGGTASVADANYNVLRPNCVAGNNGPWVLKQDWAGSTDWVYYLYPSAIKGTMFAGSPIFSVKWDGTTMSSLGTSPDGTSAIAYKTWVITPDYDTNSLMAYTFNGTNFTHVGTDYAGLNHPEPNAAWADDNYLYIGDATKLYAFTFNGTAFTKLAEFNTGDVVGGIYGDGAYIYIGNKTGGVKAFKFNGSAFTQIAATNASGDWYGPVVQTMDGTLFVNGYVGGVYAFKFNGINFTQVGNFDSNGVTTSLSTDGYHIFASNNHNGGGAQDLYALTFDGSNFTNLGYYTIGSDIKGNPVVDGENVYASDNGDIYVLGGFECTKASLTRTTIPPGPVTYLKFDETGGTVAQDSSGRDNHGNLINGPTFVTGKSNNAVQLDATNDYVELMNESQFDFEKNQDFTLSGWFYVTDNSAAHDFVTKTDSASGYLGYGFGQDTGSVAFILNSTGGKSSKITTAKPTANAWHHYVVTYNGSTSVGAAGMKIYIDGVAAPLGIVTDTVSAGASMLNNKSLRVGLGDGGNALNGKADAVVIYDRALSAADVTALYTLTATDAASGSTGNAPFVLPTGLIGYWKFDETSGTTAADSSGNGNTATLNGNAAFSSGKVGGGLLLDGSGDFVKIGKPASLNDKIKTMCAWVDQDTTPDQPGIFDKSDNNSIGVQMTVGTTNHLRALFNGVYRETSALSTFNSWAFLCETWTGTSTTHTSVKIYVNGIEYTGPWDWEWDGGSISSDASYDLYIGKVNGTGASFHGKIDEAMVFNRALSVTEINNIYKRRDSAPATSNTKIPGMPSGVIAYWSFDETSGTTAADGSGSGLTGTLVNGPTFVAGKKNNALQFDGVNDYVNLGAADILDNIKPVTMCTWLKITGHDGHVKDLLDKTTNGNDGLQFFYGDYGNTAGPHLGFAGYDQTYRETQGAGTYGTWQHFCATWSGGASGNTDIHLYLDGSEFSAISDYGRYGTAGDAAIPAVIGRTSGQSTGYFQGLLDEMIVFNRVLTADEIRQVYTASGGKADLEPNASVVMAANQYKGKIGMGDGQTCAIKPDGSAWCGGIDAGGQLGNGPVLTDSQVLSRVNDSAAFTSITAGTGFSCGIKADATGWCWGDGTAGRMGVGDTLSYDSPRIISGGYLWSQLYAGNVSACGIRNDGALYCWGYDAGYGRLGNGSSATVNIPTAVSGNDIWLQVSVGDRVACGIKSNGQLWCWGGNDYGQLGIGGTSYVPHNTPIEIIEPGPWVSVAVGSLHTCAVKLDGSAWCWGYNDHGQLGTKFSSTPNMNSRYMSPVPVSGPGGWLEVFSGPSSNVTFGIKMDGTAWSWGGDTSGVNGTNATTPVGSYEPVMITDPGPWATLATQNQSACGIKVDGSAWCWGKDTAYQLVNGSAYPDLVVDKYVPSRVLNFPDIAPLTWNDTATALTLQGSANIGMGTNSAISYDGTYSSGLPNGLRFDTGGNTVLRQTTGSTGWAPPSGIIGWWKFDEASGSTTAADSSSNGITGTLVGGASFSTGKSGNAILLNGTSGYVNMGKPAALNNKIRTMCAWVNADTDTWNNIIDKSNNSSIGPQLYADPGYGTGGLFDGNDLKGGEYVVTIGTWKHECATVSSSHVVKIYQNGVYLSQQTGNSFQDDSSYNFAVGITMNSMQWPFHGKIDEVMVFDRELAATEIADIYANSTSGAADITAGTQLKLESQAASTSTQMTWKTALGTPWAAGIDYSNSNFEIGLNTGATNWMHTITGSMSIATNGYVGVGTTSATPLARLDLGAAGNLRIGNDTTDCVPLRAGTLRYVGGSTPYEYCDGTSWTAF